MNPSQLLKWLFRTGISTLVSILEILVLLLLLRNLYYRWPDSGENTSIPISFIWDNTSVTSMEQSFNKISCLLLFFIPVLNLSMTEIIPVGRPETEKCPEVVPLGQVQKPDLQPGKQGRLQNSLLHEIFCREPVVMLGGVLTTQHVPMDLGTATVLQGPETVPEQIWATEDPATLKKCHKIQEMVKEKGHNVNHEGTPQW